MTQVQEDIQETMDLSHGIDFLCQDQPPHVIMGAIATFLTNYFRTAEKELQIELTTKMISYIVMPLCTDSAKQAIKENKYFVNELMVLIKNLQHKCQAEANGS